MLFSRPGVWAVLKFCIRLIDKCFVLTARKK